MTLIQNASKQKRKYGHTEQSRDQRDSNLYVLDFSRIAVKHVIMTPKLNIVAG